MLTLIHNIENSKSKKMVINLFGKNKKKIFIFLFIFTIINVCNMKNLMPYNYKKPAKTITANYQPNYMDANDTNDTIISSENIDDKEVKYAKLYKYNNKFNDKFNVTNMFPGDSETKYYCVNVSYKDDITIKQNINIKTDYQKLKDIFNLKIKLLNTDDFLYNDLLKNIPETIDYKITSKEKISKDFCYEITIHLDTSVGNEYQNKEAIIDFEWLVNNKDLELPSTPATNDNIIFWISMAITSSILLIILLLVFKKRGKDQNE